MVTINTSDIAGGANDHATLALWEAATDINLVSADTVEKALLFATETHDTANSLVFAGATTDSTRYREITANPGDETDGTPGSGAGITQDTSGQYCARIQEDYFRLTSIFLNGTGVSNSAVLCTVDVQEMLIENCLIHDIPTSRRGVYLNVNPTNVAIRIRNCYFSNCETGVLGNTSGRDKLVCDYVTVVRQETDANSATTGFRYCLCTNCAAFHFGPTSSHADYLNLDAGSSNNASHDTTGDSGLTSLVAADEFVSITDDAMDLHLQSGSTLEGAGTPIAGLTTDFDGDARHASAPDVGADEYTASGISLTVPTIDVTTTATAPDVTLGAVSISVPTIAVTTTVTAPSVVLGAVLISVPTIAVTTTVTAPSVVLGAVSITVPTIAVTTTVTPPSVSLSGGPQSVVMPTIAATVTATAPSVTLGAVSISVPTISITATVTAPSVVLGAVSITVPTITATATVTPPSVVLGERSVTVPTIALSALVTAPDISLGEAIVVVPGITVTATATAPSVVNADLILGPYRVGLLHIAAAGSTRSRLDAAGPLADHLAAAGAVLDHLCPH